MYVYFSKIIMEQVCKIVLILIRHPVFPNYMLLLTTMSIQNLRLFSNFTFQTDLVTLSVVVYKEKSSYIWHQSIKNSFWHFSKHFGKKHYKLITQFKYFKYFKDFKICKRVGQKTCQNAEYQEM